MVDTRDNYKSQTRRADGTFGPVPDYVRAAQNETPWTRRRDTFVEGPANGTMTVMIFGKPVVFTGGPYRHRPPGLYGIKMAAEIDLPCHFDIPTVDFQTPDREVLYQNILSVAGKALTGYTGFYVGCMGGMGRTGLFLACMAAMSGVANPITYTRQRYMIRAVETREQERFVLGFKSRYEDRFRNELMDYLIAHGAINFTWLKKLSWADRRLWAKRRFPRLGRLFA